jgi:hypothetical protein
MGRSERDFLSELRTEINELSRTTGNAEIRFPGDKILIERLKSGKKIDLATALSAGNGNKTGSIFRILRRAFAPICVLFIISLLVYLQTGIGWMLSASQIIVVVILCLLWIIYIVGVNSLGIDRRVRRLLPGSLVFSGPTNAEINKVMDSIEKNINAFSERGGVYRKKLTSTMRNYGVYNAIVLNNQGLELWATRGLLMKKTTFPWLTIPVDQIEAIDVVRTGVGAFSDNEYAMRAIKISTNTIAPIVVVIDEKHADYETRKLAAYAVRDKLIEAVSAIRNDPSLYPRVREFDMGRFVWWLVFFGVIIAFVLLAGWAAGSQQAQIDQYGFYF